MASNPRFLTDEERAEVVAVIRPLVDRYADRFGVSESAVIAAVQQYVPPRRRLSLPANYTPANPLIAKMMKICAEHTRLSPASIAEDPFDRAQSARDALIYAARNGFELSYETIAASLGGLDSDEVMDGYCRAIGRLENADKGFSNLIRAMLAPFAKRLAR